jgi:predicted membrane-bound spermidine synthase
MKKFKLLLIIFFITFSTIIVEILYTRVFSMIYFSSFAFLMISLALFGYGLSGVFISMSKMGKKENSIQKLEYFILSYALLLPVIYKITLTAKIDFLNLFNTPTNFIILLLNFLVLLIPFFIAGVSLVLIFSLYSEEIGKLYFIDLIGAALGGIAIIPLITSLGPSKIILLLFLIMTVLWYLISGFGRVKKLTVFIVVSVLFLGMFKFSDKIFPVIPKIKKREYLNDFQKKRIEYSKWSSINKIDIAPVSKFKKNVWLNGGTQQSWLIRHNRLIEKTKKPILWFHQSIPFQLTKKDSAFIIGSAGGYEVLCALTHKFKSIYAVEMDPAICHIIAKTGYADYIGNIFNRKGVYLINDEGRSVLKRMKDRQFDVIQMVNSHPTDTLLSGGLSVAETYIYTVESFKDYWIHLNPEGFLSIVHVFGERLFATAYQALRELQVNDPGKKFFVIQAKNGFNYFFMKKGDINPRDQKLLTIFFEKLRLQFPVEIIYAPHLKKENTYYQIASANYCELYRKSSVNINPVRDNSPYFNQPNKIGQFSFENIYIAGLSRLMINNAMIRSNSVYLSILFISILFSLLLIYLPLKIKNKKHKINFNPIFYFFFIGMAFIIVEIILIKIFQLYLGNPAYSISVIIFSLLISSGIGSLLSGKINQVFKNTILFVTVFLVILISLYALFLFEIIYSLIHFSLVIRLFISLVLISILGIPMGIYFPTGLKQLGKKNKTMIGWAWGANAFATVLGSIITVIVAINWNFTVVLLLAAACYLIAGILFHLNLKKNK